MRNKIKNKKPIALLLSAVVIVSILAIGLIGTFAMNSNDKDWIEFELISQRESYTKLENAAGKTATWTVGGANVDGWASSNNGVAEISTGTTSANGIITPVSAGVATIISGNVWGETNYRNYQVYDDNNIVRYKFNDGRSAKIKNIGDTIEMKNKVTTENGKAVSVNNDIEWESWSQEIAAVTAAGTVTAVTEGTAIIVGKITDKWGVEQLIPFTVTVGDLSGGTGLGDGVVQIGEDYYRPVLDEEGNPSGVWEKTDASGEESTDDFVGGNDKIPNPFDPLYKIQPEDNEEAPPANSFANNYEGYLTTVPEGTSEYDQWQIAKDASKVDKSALQEIIDTTNQLNGNDYNSGLWAVVQEKLADANRVNDDPDATQQEVDDAANALRSAVNALGIFTVGSEITMGKYGEEDELEWQVLDIDAANNRVLVITTTVAAECLFHPTTPYPTWKNSNIRRFLQEDFYNRYFTDADREKILLSNITTKTAFNSSNTETTQDYLFLLSEEEIKDYWDAEKKRIPKTTNKGEKSSSSSIGTSWGYNRYWLRNPRDNTYSAAYINNSGYIYGATVIYGKDLPSTDRNQGGVRPAMWLDLSKF